MSSNSEYIKEYEEEIKKDPTAYSCFDDYLGANALTRCEDCDNIVEYDEVDEDGYCFDCSP